MENYASNSNKSKEEKNDIPEKKVEKIVSGKKAKKTGMQKFADQFIREDMPDIGTYLWEDIFKPTLKRLVVDTVESILYPGGERGRGRDRRPSDYVSYRRYSDRDRDRGRDNRPSDRRGNRSNGYSYDDVVLETRGDAEAVLSQLEDIIDIYEQASVGDLYDLVGITPRHTDNKYGWEDISNASIIRDRDGMYVIRMPRAIPLT